MLKITFRPITTHLACFQVIFQLLRFLFQLCVFCSDAPKTQKMSQKSTSYAENHFPPHNDSFGVFYSNTAFFVPTLQKRKECPKNRLPMLKITFRPITTHLACFQVIFQLLRFLFQICVFCSDAPKTQGMSQKSTSHA